MYQEVIAFDYCYRRSIT